METATDQHAHLLAQVKAALAADSGGRSSADANSALLLEISQALEKDSYSATRGDLGLATEIEDLIPRITARVAARHSALRTQFEANAPWGLVPLDYALDLLKPLGRLHDETTHTQVLAYLMNPDGLHGLGVRVLREFFALLGRIIPGEDTFERLGVETPKVIETLRQVQVRAEENVKTAEGVIRRCDLWLELQEPTSTMIVVIENKVEAGEHGGQLSAYEDAVWNYARQRRRLNFEGKLVFLTPKGDDPAENFDQRLWLPVSYLQLAGALARASRDAPEPGRTFLNLYTASVLRLLGIPSTAEGIRRIDQLPYLDELGSIYQLPYLEGFPELGGAS